MKLKRLAWVMALLCLALVFILPAQAVNATDDRGDYFYYEWPYSGERGSIDSCAISVSGDLIIPGVLGGWQVTSISSYAFADCSGLTSVTIPDGVTLIGSYAFSGCSSLTSVIIPGSVTHIRDSVFDGCPLEKIIYCGTAEQWNAITISSENTSLQNAQLQYHDQFALCNGVCANCGTQVGPALGHNEVTAAAVAPTCTQTGLTEGKRCSRCGEVFLGLEMIPALGHQKVTDPAVAPTCTKPGLTEGSHCSRCGEVIVGQQTTQFATHSYTNNACMECGIRKPIASGNSGENLCWSLDEAGTLTIYGSGAMPDYDCGDPYYGPLQGNDIPVDRCDGYTHAPWGSYHSQIAHAVIMDGVTSIGVEAFYGCDNMLSISIPDSVSNIGTGAFYACSNLKEVALSHTITTLPESIFDRCSSLTEVNIPNSVTKINQYAFYGCPLEKIAYCGTEDQWNQIVISSGNTALQDAQWQQHNWQPICTTGRVCTACGLREGLELGHNEVTDAAAAPTCTANGLTEGSHCDRCGEVIVAQNVIPALGHSYAYADNGDGTHDYACSRCGAAEIDNAAHSYTDRLCICGAKEVLDLNGISRAKTLSLSDVVYMKATVAFMTGSGANAKLTKEEILENGRLLFWREKELPEGDMTVENALAVQKLSDSGIYDDGIQEYYAYSYGVAPKEYGDQIYYRTYIVIDGIEYYGQVNRYSVLTYANNQLKKDSGSLKPLLAAMLNYGAAAQQFFNYKTDELVNAGLQDWVDKGLLDAQCLVMQWDESLLNLPEPADQEIARNFQQNDAWRTNRSLILEGTVQPKMSFAYKEVNGKGSKLPADASVTVYCWSSEKYNALYDEERVLTKGNASYVLTGAEILQAYDSTKGYVYHAYFEGVPAKRMGDPLYIAAVFTMADGTQYCSGVEVYSPEVYTASMLKKEITTETLANLMKWMVIYGEEAKAYFAG